MDLDDLDNPTQQPARAVRFTPRPRLKKPSVKPTPDVAPPKSEPIQEAVEMAPAVVVVKKEVEVEEVPTESSVDKMDVDVAEKVSGEAEKRNVSISDASEIDWEALKRDAVAKEKEDYVVAEYDVYYTTPASDTQLYVMQHPMRPLWRPYELEQRCTEVRVRPTSAAVEVDMLIEMESENYSHDSPVAARMEKQTIASSGRQPQAAAYAVGLLTGKKLYLNPIHAVVQLRPSFEYLDFVDVKKKSAPFTVKEEGSINNSLAGTLKKQGNETDQQVIEPWISLKYHSSTSDLAQTYLRKMVTEESNPLKFSMNPYDYLNCLCPGAMINKTKSNGLSKRSLLSLPLEIRLKKLLVEGPHIQRFSAIKHLAPDDSAENVIKILQQHAHLVQGVWVARSGDQYVKGSDKLVRDYALFLFSQNPIIKDTELDILGHLKSSAKTIICDIAVERENCKDWKFKEATDLSFIKLYPDIVEHQRNIWQRDGNMILERLLARGHGPRRPMPFAPSVEGLGRATNEARSQDGLGTATNEACSQDGLGRATNEARSVSISMPREAREALSKVLGKLFLTHKVCSLQTIRQGLRDTAVSMSVLPKAGGRSSSVVAAVKNVVDAPQEELQAIINEYAVNVHGLYLLKSSSENQELNPLRNDVIELFRGREPGAKVKKSEIIEAATNKPATTEFQKVINEYCVSKGGAWVLKSGDQVSPSDWQNIFKAAKLL